MEQKELERLTADSLIDLISVPNNIIPAIYLSVI